MTGEREACFFSVQDNFSISRYQIYISYINLMDKNFMMNLFWLVFVDIKFKSSNID